MTPTDLKTQRKAQTMSGIHIRQDHYTKRWHIYSAPFMPLYVKGKRAPGFDTEGKAQEWLESNNDA